MNLVAEKIPFNRIFQYDIETYHRLTDSGVLPRNTELIYGVVVNKMTLSPIHRKVVNKLRDILSHLVSQGYIILQESPLTINKSEPEPDISIVKGSYDDFGDKHPESAEFVIEVAYSSLEDDLRKANIYASANIPVYWILDIQNRTIEIFQSPENGVYTFKKTLNADEKILIPLTNHSISFSEFL